jgi:hypothetical protein
MKLSKKSLRGFLWALLIVAVICLLGPLAVALLYQDRIKSTIRSAFTSHSTQVLSDFKVSMSVVEHFPYATLTLKDIVITDTAGRQPVDVLSAGRVSIKFNLISLFSGKPNAKGLVLEGGTVQQLIDSTGRKTALRFKKNEKPASTPEFTTQVPSIAVRNVRIFVDNRYKRIQFDFRVDEANLALAVQEGVLSVSGPLSGTVNHIQSKKMIFFRNKSFRADARYAYRLDTRVGTVSRLVLRLPRSLITISGTHAALPGREGNLLNMRIRGRLPTGDLLKEVLPARLQTYLDSTDIRSMTHFHYHLAGETTPTIRPWQRLAFRVADSQVRWRRAEAHLHDLRVAGVFDNGKGQSPLTSTLTIHEMRARTRQGFVQAKLHLANFEYPELEGSLTGNFNLREWAAILRLPHDSTYAGTVQAKLGVKGPIHELQQEYLKKTLVWEGDMKLQGVAFRPQTLAATCTDLNGNAFFRNNLLQLEGVSGKMGGYPFRVEATAQDLLRYGLGLSKAVAVRAMVQADAVRADWFLPRDSVRKDSVPFLVPEFLQVQAALTCNQVILRQDTVSNLSVRLQSDKDQVRLNDLSLEMFNGTLVGSIALPNNRYQLDKAQVQLTARLDELDLEGAPFGGARPAPRKKARTGRTLDLKDLLLSDQSRLSLFIAAVNLPGQEDLKDLAVHVTKDGDLLSLGNLQCQTTMGGRISGKGEGIFRNGRMEDPRLDLNLAYGRLNLQKLIGLFAAARRPKTAQPKRAAARTATGKQSVVPEYQINFTVTADQLFYEALTGSQFYLKAALHDDNVRLHHVTMQAFGGRFTSSGSLQLPDDAQEYPLRLHTQLQEMDLTQVFAAVDMLGLDVLNSRNVRGGVDCSVFVRTSLDQTFLPSIPRTVMYTNAFIHNMELIEVEAIGKALHFLREKKTSHLYFEDVAMKFILDRGRFIVPGTELNSNLSHLFLAGTYNMGKEANLHFDVAILDVLFGNNKRRVEKVVTDQELGKPRMVRHLALQREAGQYKLRMFNKQENLQAVQQMRDEFQAAVYKYQIDTTSAPGQSTVGPLTTESREE